VNTIKPIYVKKSKIPQTLFTLAFCMSASCLAITTIFNANLLIIADAGLLYTAVDVDDQYHQRSKTQIQRINGENLTILLSFPVY
jgi:hypothetical protein